MPFKALQDVTLSKIDPTTGSVGVSQTWGAGQEIPDSEVSPSIVQRFEEGDEHLLGLIELIEEPAPRRGGRRRKAADEDSVAEAAAE